MAYGAGSRRTDRNVEFSEAQRLYLLEKDVDELVAQVAARLDRIDKRQLWVLATFVGMIITFASVLLSILGTR